MKISPRFRGARSKIDRSKRHYDELQFLIDEFIKSKPYALIQSYDSNSDTAEFRVRVSSDIPLGLGPIVGDVVHNLRSTLDILAVELAKENGQTSRTAIDKTYFPVSSSKMDFESTGVLKIKRLSSSSQDIIKNLCPYKGGNDLLWELHQLDILDKHILLVPVGCALVNPEISIGTPAAIGDFEISATLTKGGAKYPIKDGDLIYSASCMSVGPRIEVKTQFTVAFGEGRIVDGRPVMPKLFEYGQLVEEIVNTFETASPF